jgi:hypothetical protein
MRETLITHPGGRCFGHLEWSERGTMLVVDHCECLVHCMHGGHCDDGTGHERQSDCLDPWPDGAAPSWSGETA